VTFQFSPLSGLAAVEIPKEFLLKMIENEIKADPVFAALAHAGEDALTGNQLEQIRSLTRQVSALREKLDLLLSKFEAQKS
jgi:hypothetical protein